MKSRLIKPKRFTGDSSTIQISTIHRKDGILSIFGIETTSGLHVIVIVREENILTNSGEEIEIPVHAGFEVINQSSFGMMLTAMRALDDEGTSKEST